MTSGDRVAVVGTGLIGTSVALAAARAGAVVTGWDADASVTARAAALAKFRAAASVEDAVAERPDRRRRDPDPHGRLPRRSVPRGSPRRDRDRRRQREDGARARCGRRGARGLSSSLRPGASDGGSERSGPEHASASVFDAIVWAITPHEASDPEAVDALEAWTASLGARPVRLDPERHDRLVAFVSHLPQVASTALMSLAATEEAGEPEILLLAAGGFRDLTRLAASNPALWSDILLANQGAIGEAIDLYIERLVRLRDEIVGGRGGDVEETFDEAKRARLRLATKPTVRAGVAVLQIEVPDRPGALADLTAVLGGGEVNIEDLQIVHSPEGGRGTVHLTVAADAVDRASHVLDNVGLDPIRLA